MPKKTYFGMEILARLLTDPHYSPVARLGPGASQHDGSFVSPTTGKEALRKSPSPKR